MRRVYRVALPTRVQAYLEERTGAVLGGAPVVNVWSTARGTKALRAVFRTLQQMAGPRERCMYCVDSHGSDIEHFWPKAPYPERAFDWSNMLLCCTECGRFKGDRFPLAADCRPMLVDPSVEDPWEHLDFDPDTGNVTSRYDAITESTSARGDATVQLLRLDRREAMTEGYRRTYQRIADRVRQVLIEEEITDSEGLVTDLMRIDDHGLMGWCFGPVGSTVPPFDALRKKDPRAWERCATAAR